VAVGAPVRDEVLLEVGITVFGQDLKEILVRSDPIRPYVVFVTTKDETVSVYLNDLEKEGECPKPKKSKKSA
jgi:hypothetical protein